MTPAGVTFGVSGTSTGASERVDKKTWEVPETDAGAPPPTVFTQEQARRLEREKLAQIVHKPSIDKLGESGIMKAITVDDFELRTYGQGIQKDVEKVMLSEIRQVEKRCGVVISDIRIEEMSDSTKGREAIVTEILPNGLLCMHFNKAIFSIYHLMKSTRFLLLLIQY